MENQTEHMDSPKKNQKTIIKLDRDFHIYIHGDYNKLERGYDKDRDMSYYKLYFKEEQ